MTGRHRPAGDRGGVSSDVTAAVSLGAGAGAAFGVTLALATDNWAFIGTGVAFGVAIGTAVLVAARGRREGSARDRRQDPGEDSRPGEDRREDRGDDDTSAGPGPG